jgi:hypothetical protein
MAALAAFALLGPAGKRCADVLRSSIEAVSLHCASVRGSPSQQKQAASVACVQSAATSVWQCDLPEAEQGTRAAAAVRSTPAASAGCDQRKLSSRKIADMVTTKVRHTFALFIEVLLSSELLTAWKACRSVC